jgi:3'(2'), 5'-bisphosphate nucleotidase
MEWDTAAGHAILQAAGGRVQHPDGRAFTYGKPHYKNGPFIAMGQ